MKQRCIRRMAETVRERINLNTELSIAGASVWHQFVVSTRKRQAHPSVHQYYSRFIRSRGTCGNRYGGGGGGGGSGVSRATSVYVSARRRRRRGRSIPPINTLDRYRRISANRDQYIYRSSKTRRRTTRVYSQLSSDRLSSLQINAA